MIAKLFKDSALHEACTLIPYKVHSLTTLGGVYLKPAAGQPSEESTYEATTS